MYTMQEALAREHMRQLEVDASRHRLVSEAAGSRRRYLRTSVRRGRQAHPSVRRSPASERSVSTSVE